MSSTTRSKSVRCPECGNFNAPCEDGFFRCNYHGCDAIYILEGAELCVLIVAKK